MANPYVNKVVYGSSTIIDLTSDTVDAAHLSRGVTAHSASGAQITGTLDPPSGTKTITATTSTQTGIDVSAYATVTVNPTPSESKTVTDNGTVTPSSGKLLSSVVVTVPYKTYRTGSGAPSSSLGNDGDIYIDIS